MSDSLKSELPAGLRLVFGGAFDPVHAGHLALAEFALQHCQATTLTFLPAGRSPFKSGHGASFEQRCEMLRLAIAGELAFRLDEREGRRQGPSFTVDTLEEMYHEDKAPLGLLIGGDNLGEFPRWRNWERILELARLIVINRPGAAAAAERIPHLALEWPGMELSSTWLRQQLSEGVRCRYLLPQGVWSYIHEHGLYHGDTSRGVPV